jgi:hypothetical protein
VLGAATCGHVLDLARLHIGVVRGFEVLPAEHVLGRELANSQAADAAAGNGSGVAADEAETLAGAQAEARDPYGGEAGAW